MSQKKSVVLIAVVIVSAALTFGLLMNVERADARNSMLEEVNATCGTSYGCGLCHQDPKGGGPLTQQGSGYAASGNDACYFCATVCNPPTDPEICNDGVDNDLDGRIDCADSDCAKDPACVSVCVPIREAKGRTCSDGIDNDCDGLTDCTDPDCARNRLCKTR